MSRSQAEYHAHVQELFSLLYKKIERSSLDSLVKKSLARFYETYHKALQSEPDGQASESCCRALGSYVDLIEKESASPKAFDHFHKREESPFDYFKFGLAMVRPLIDAQNSIVLGQEHIAAINQALDRKENVFLLANHQTEIDPQIISLLVEPFSQQIFSSLTSVAGHRVLQDPFAIPFSRGCNLICIYSKKYIDFPPEKKEEKLLHNSRAMRALEELLNQGGACIYVAPSGGRDRIDAATGRPAPALFDAQSIEMFRLLAKKSGQKSHFHLLALHTMEMLPPPDKLHTDLGEERRASRVPAGLVFGPEIDMQAALPEDIAIGATKQQLRELRAQYLHKKLSTMYIEIEDLKV